MNDARFTRKTAPRDWLAFEEWPEIDNRSLDDVKRLRMNTLATGIKDYIKGETITSFLGKHHISWEAFLRAFNRCIAYDECGRQFGWRGLLPRLRVRAPVRTKPLLQCGREGRGGLSGVNHAEYSGDSLV